jgi:SagB-type dehydrogenase family enzyme
MVKKKSGKDRFKNKRILLAFSIPLIIFLVSLVLLAVLYTTIISCTAFKDVKTDNVVRDEKNTGTIKTGLVYLEGEDIILPEPEFAGSISLEEAILNRRSIRDFNDREIEIEKISQLLWAAQGITKKTQGFRTAPSAGALYPLDIFLIKKDGLFHYIPVEHKLKKMSKKDLHQRLYEACLYQNAVAKADINIVITAVYERTTVKYGERGIRYVHMEAGHACQNILLEAVVLDLGAVPVGAFEDSKINEIMGLHEDHIPLYVIPVGYAE